MGFDLYGMNPIMNKPKPDILIKHKWDELPQEKQKEYWDAENEDTLNNPGQYFRANIHWWFPLWEFVSTMCSDILTEKDIKSCEYNDGYEITEDKAIKIAERLETLNNSGEIKQYENALDAQPIGARNKDGDMEWYLSRTFSVNVVMSFAKFCKESGGFVVC